jgi:hypothetical protein
MELFRPNFEMNDRFGNLDDESPAVVRIEVTHVHQLVLPDEDIDKIIEEEHGNAPEAIKVFLKYAMKASLIRANHILAMFGEGKCGDCESREECEDMKKYIELGPNIFMIKFVLKEPELAIKLAVLEAAKDNVNLIEVMDKLRDERGDIH